MASYGAVWRARLQMMRPGNGAMVVVAVWLGAALTRTDSPWFAAAADAFLGQGPVRVYVAAPLAAFLINSFGNVLNDISDRAIDATAHPARPLPSGRVGVGDAQVFAGMLLVLGLIEATLAGGLPLLAFAGAVAALLALYEWRLKRWPLVGNLAVAALVASAFAFGALAGGEGPDAAVWWVMAMVGLTTLARELLKDIEDARADTDRRTLAQLTPQAAGWLAAAAVGVAVGIDASLVWQQPWHPAGRAGLALAGIAFLAAAGAGCWKAAWGQRALKAAMLVALVGLALAPL